MIVGEILLALGLIGTAASTVVLVLTILGAIKFHGARRRDRETIEKWAAKLPPVSILKPVHGVEAELHENLSSFFEQDYPNKIEVIFAADYADDAALPIVREVCAKYPHVPTRIMITGNPPWPNAQNFCFHHMSQAARYDMLVTSDSDTQVGRDYLKHVISPLMDPKVGCVTNPFRGKATGGMWSYWDAIGQTVEFNAGILMSNLLEETKFALGPSVVVRRDALERVGGFAAIREYLSNDFAMGNFIHKAGYQVVMSSHIVDHLSQPMSFHRMWHRQLRWAMGSRYSRPKGHVGTGLTFAVPYGIIAAIACWILGMPALGWGLLGASLLNRMLLCWVVGWWMAKDPVSRNSILIYPLRDLHGFLIWCASYLSKRSLWRDNDYTLLEGGRLISKRANGELVTADFAKASHTTTAGSDH